MGWVNLPDLAPQKCGQFRIVSVLLAPLADGGLFPVRQFAEPERQKGEPDEPVEDVAHPQRRQERLAEPVQLRPCETRAGVGAEADYDQPEEIEIEEDDHVGVLI